MLDFLLPWVVALLSLLPASSEAREALQEKFAGMPGKAAVLVEMPDIAPPNAVEPALEIPNPSPDNLTLDTGKVPAYNSASDKVLGSVAEVAVEKSKVLEPCTPELCPLVKAAAPSPIPMPSVSPKPELPIIIEPPYPGLICPPWPPIESSLQAMPDRVICMD